MVVPDEQQVSGFGNSAHHDGCRAGFQPGFIHVRPGVTSIGAVSDVHPTARVRKKHGDGAAGKLYSHGVAIAHPVRCANGGLSLAPAPSIVIGYKGSHTRHVRSCEHGQQNPPRAQGDEVVVGGEIGRLAAGDQCRLRPGRTVVVGVCHLAAQAGVGLARLIGIPLHVRLQHPPAGQAYKRRLHDVGYAVHLAHEKLFRPGLALVVRPLSHELDAPLGHSTVDMVCALPRGVDEIEAPPVERQDRAFHLAGSVERCRRNHVIDFSGAHLRSLLR